MATQISCSCPPVVTIVATLSAARRQPAVTIPPQHILYGQVSGRAVRPDLPSAPR